MKKEITSKISKLKAKIKRPGGKSEMWWKVTTPAPGGGRTRRFFSTEADADTYIEQQSIQLANFGTAGASMDETLRGAALRAQEILQPLGLNIVDAAKHYADYITSIKGGIPLAKAIERFKDSRKGGNYSDTYRKSLGHNMKHFLEAFPDKTTRDITPSEIDGFVSGRGAMGSQRTYRKFIKALYNFLIEEGLCDKNPVRKGKAEKVTYNVQILTPGQCAKLIEACDDETLPSVAIGMYCGLRASEISRIDWPRVNTTEGIIILDTEITKTGTRRVVPIPEACKQWITPYAKTEGPVQPVDFRNKFDLVRVRAGFKPSYSGRNDKELQALLADAAKRKVKLQEWPQNCLRHSAISYGLAECGDASKVATWAGNTPAVIKEHYDSQALPSAAKKFYSILPVVAVNVESIPAAKAA